MFEVLISMFEKYLSHGQQYIDMGVAYDSIGQFEAGAAYHTKAYKLLKRNPGITQSALDRYSKSITGYARYYFAIKDMQNNEQYQDEIEGVSIFDEAVALSNDYDLHKTGFKVLSTDELLKLETTIKHFHVFKRDHVDRRLESNLPKERFDIEYAQHGRPVLIRMDASKSFVQTYKKWKRASLLSKQNKYRDL